jgi:hypothetical protein
MSIPRLLVAVICLMGVIWLNTGQWGNAFFMMPLADFRSLLSLGVTLYCRRN